jgi:nucleoside-diphosphate-sugar epimerase
MSGPVVLVTGASGVVGTAVLRELSGYSVIAAAYRRLPAGEDRMVRLDLSAPLLGLDPAAYQRLCTEVDIVVHSAAIVNFSADQAEVDRINVEGLGRIIEFVAEADAVLVHVSTAYVSRYGKAGGGDQVGKAKSAARTDEYVASKFRGEQMVRDSGLDAVIVRPSVVIGDSRTGEIRQAQGVHTLAEYMIKGQLPFLPALPGSFLDLVPQDVLAQGVRAIIDAGLRKGELWLTAGPGAMPAERFLDLVAEEAAQAGRAVARGRLADPGIVDRLVRPAFEDVVSKDDLSRLDGAVAVCGLVITTDLLPTSFGQIPGGPAELNTADVEQAWRVSLRRLTSDLA